MFTGIVEAQANVIKLVQHGSGVDILFSSPISDDLQVNQSVSHNGVCLTVTKLEKGKHWVTAVKETLQKSNLGRLQPGDTINLERCMLNNGRFDGHIVQGHVDQMGTVESIKDENGSWLFRFSHEPSAGSITVEKGSICVNGISLTCFDSRKDGFSVAIIPYTFDHTNFHDLEPGDQVNLEFDIVGKYISKLMGKVS